MRRELDALREELSIIIGVGDSVADRITAAISAATPVDADQDARSGSRDDRDATVAMGAAA